VTVVIAAGASLAGFGITLVVLCLCCKRPRRQPRDLERSTPPPATPPAFIQYEKQGVKDGHVRLPSGDSFIPMNMPTPLAVARSRSPVPVRPPSTRIRMLSIIPQMQSYAHPPVKQPPGSSLRYETQTQQTRTTGSELVTAFSV
jgi:hypothetical protein